VRDHFTTKALALPAPEQEFIRADLAFYGLDHSGPTYEGRIFLGAKRSIRHGAGIDEPAYAGSFFVFGHGTCHGDVGHCEIPEKRDAFDLRFPHHLTPGATVVTVTDRVRALIEEGRAEAKVTVLAYGADEEPVEALDFTRLRLLTYA
jgi:tyrosinase